MALVEMKLLSETNNLQDQFMIVASAYNYCNGIGVNQGMLEKLTENFYFRSKLAFQLKMSTQKLSPTNIIRIWYDAMNKVLSTLTYL